jgi:DNA-binding CsgD family transcriptional regulator
VAAIPVAEETIVGRAAERAVVEGFVDGSLARTLVLEGEAGIGKTVLWRIGIEAADRQGYAVLRARPATAETSLTLVGLHDLLDEVSGQFRQRLPEVQRHALAAALGEEDAHGLTSEPGVLGVAVLRLLAAIAAERPVLVAIADLQWLDEATGAVLVYALRRAGDAPIRLLATCRGKEGAVLPFALEQSLDARALERLAVGPLSEGAIRRLLRLRLGLNLSRIDAHAAYAASGGNPFFALELGRAGIETDGAGALVLPHSLYELVDMRVAKLPALTRASLLYVAALAEPTLSALERAGVSDSLDAAFSAGVLDLEGERVRFAHPLIACAASSAADDEHRRDVHRALAGVVDDTEQRARHLAAVAVRPDTAVARFLEQAALGALRRGAPAAAAALFDQARGLLARDARDEWARLAEAAVGAHVRAGHWDSVDSLVAEANARLPAGLQRAGILVASAELRPGLHGLLRQAVVDAGPSAAGVRSRLALTEQAALVGRWSESVETAREAEELARRLGDRSLLGVTLAFVGGMKLLDSQPGGTREIEASVAIEDEVGSLPSSAFQSPRTWLASARLWRGEVDSARALLLRQLATAAERGDDTSIFQLRQLLILLELRAGELAAGRALGEEALEQVEMLGYQYGRPILWSALSHLEAWAGDLDRAHELGGAAVDALAAIGDRLWSTHAHAALLLADVCGGDGPAALGHLGAISDALPGPRECWWSYHQGDELEALALAGDHERALGRAAALRHAGRELGLPRFLAWADRGEGLVRIARGENANAVLAFEAALRHHDGFAAPLERARTLLAWGHGLRLERRRREARAALADALALFDRLGAARFAQTARSEMAHVGGRAPGDKHHLTGTEERIAQLVSDGLSNRAVAEELFVSISTVEAALIRVYRKLGVGSRSQLTRLMVDSAHAD